MAQAGAVSTVSESRINTFMGQVFLLMSVGMVVTALVATWVTTRRRAAWQSWRINAVLGLY